MARPREFETDAAIERAMGVFWEAGYADAGLAELLAGMGIARGSLYKAFGGKKRLFLLALARYERQVVEGAVARLEGGEADGGARIRAIFADVVETVRAGDRRGCLVCTAAAGAAHADGEIAQAVAAILERLTQGFAAAVQATAEGAALAPEARLARARALTAAYVGLRVLARAGMAASMLDDIARAAWP